jgi:hypothetical protein
MPLAVDTGQNLMALRDEVKRLKKLNAERSNLHTDLELKEAKRLAADGIANVAKVRELWDAKLAAEQREFELGRKEDAERIARYEKRVADDAKRIRALEQEIAMLKAATAQEAETLPVFMKRLSLEAHLSTLQDEELDVNLLRSMGREELECNMAELGMATGEIARLANELFGPATAPVNLI